MSSTDDPGADPEGLGLAREVAAERVHSQLVEALVLLLIEKGLLTRNDALSIVRTVAQVQQGEGVEDGGTPAQTQANVQMLRRMYVSFEALADRSAARLAGAENVLQLRPSIYGEPPEFPLED